MALKVPLWGNLTFAPQVEVFLFQSKVVPGLADEPLYVCDELAEARIRL